jgi:hypothetical protein
MVVNQQVSDPVSEQLEKLAVREGVPVLKLSELITDPNQDYLDWFRGRAAVFEAWIAANVQYELDAPVPAAGRDGEAPACPHNGL